jgi:hypothetical protein
MKLSLQIAMQTSPSGDSFYSILFSVIKAMGLKK